jgi:hypothetical protein
LRAAKIIIKIIIKLTKKGIEAEGGSPQGRGKSVRL